MSRARQRMRARDDERRRRSESQKAWLGGVALSFGLPPVAAFLYGHQEHLALYLTVLVAITALVGLGYMASIRWAERG